MIDKIFLIEDHDEALKLWREKKVKALNLVHIDAHIDFGFHPAKPIEKIFNTAVNLKELKRNLEYTLAFRHYEKDFDRQTNIGNYIYPAIEAGIVKDFYWVVPGGLKEFKEAVKFIKNIFRSFSKQDSYQSGCMSQALRYTLKDGILSSNLFGRRFVVCTLEKLPVLRQNILLDIDTDFLIVDSLLNANNMAKIGRRKPWILPQHLVEMLKQKIRQPEIITISYSVNGGYTPMRYKHLGDEMAYFFSPQQLRRRFRNNFQAAKYFALFSSTNERKYYQKAVKLNPAYRAADNNYGPLYLGLRKFSKAKKEFSRIFAVDPKNPFCLCGLGNIALANKDFNKAKGYFASALKESQDEFFYKAKIQGLLGLAQAEFRLKNFERAKKLLLSYQAIELMFPGGHYLLAQIYEKERNFEEAVVKYKDALRLGFNTIEVMKKLLKISLHIQAKNDTIRYLIIRYKEFKKHFLSAKRLNLRRNKKIKDLHVFERKMANLERNLEKIKV